MKLLYKRDLETSLVLSSPEASVVTPIENLYDTRLSSYVLFVIPVNEVNIHIEFSELHTVDAVGLAGHNFSASATISVNGNTPTSLTKVHSVNPFDAITDSIFDVKITDPGMNPGDARFIGRLEIGDLSPFPDISSSIKVDEISSSTAIMSDSRQAYGYRRTSYTRISLQFPFVTVAERLHMMDVFKYVDVFTPFFTLMDEVCINKGTFYGIFEDTKTLAFQFNDAHLYTTSVTISEVF